MKIINIFSRVISLIIGMIVVSIFLLLLVPRVIGYQPYTVLTGSMEPSYKIGSMIYVKPVSFEDLKIGDAVTFSGGSYVVTHRITEIDTDNKSIVTKGDANKSIDGSVSYSKIVGKASKLSIPYLGKISMVLSSVRGKILLVGILGGLFVINIIANSITDKKEATA